MGLATLIAAPAVSFGVGGQCLGRTANLLIGLAVAMALGSVSMGFYDSTWSYIAVMAPMLVVSATALSWHGILLFEVARLADGRDVEANRWRAGVWNGGSDRIPADLCHRLRARWLRRCVLRRSPASALRCLCAFKSAGQRGQ